MTRVATATSAAALLVLALAGCSDDSSGNEPEASPPRVTAEPPANDGLVRSTGRSETWECHETRVECVASQHDDETTMVRVTAPPGLEDVRRRQGRILDPFLWVEVAPGVTGEFELPLDGGSQEAAPEVAVFAVDPWAQNELSADEETSTGSITVTEAACDPDPALSFTIRATLGSELGGPGLWVKGSLPDPG